MQALLVIKIALACYAFPVQLRNSRPPSGQPGTAAQCPAQPRAACDLSLADLPSQASDAMRCTQRSTLVTEFTHRHQHILCRTGASSSSLTSSTSPELECSEWLERLLEEQT
eukprot:6173464-Pleurochrysis_carterae.AAC.2